MRSRQPQNPNSELVAHTANLRSPVMSELAEPMEEQTKPERRSDFPKRCASHVLKSCKRTGRARLRLSSVGEAGVMHARAKSTAWLSTVGIALGATSASSSTMHCGWDARLIPVTTAMYRGSLLLNGRRR